MGMKERNQPYDQLSAKWKAQLYDMHPADIAWAYFIDRLVQAWVGMMSFQMKGYTEQEINMQVVKMTEKKQKAD